MELDDIVAYSCYCSPNIKIEQYEQYINNLGADIAKHSKRVLIGGDFNAKTSEWGRPLKMQGDES